MARLADITERARSRFGRFFVFFLSYRLLLMDKESLLRRMEESAGLTVCRAGSASLARLAVEAVRAGRHAVIAVRSRDALAVMRGLTTLFTSELSVGRAGASESSARGQAERPLWERPWVFLPPFSQRSLSREGWRKGCRCCTPCGRERRRAWCSRQTT